MKRDPSVEIELSWCIIARNCAATVEAMLQSVRARTPNAEIVVVDTMSSDDTPAICQRYADVWVEYKGPNGDWTREMEWFDDARAARQLSFELAHGRWRAWIDTDDLLPGPEEAERLLKLNGRWKPRRSGQRVEAGEASPEGLEDFLRRLAKDHPAVTLLYCPYLYQKDEHDQAVTWQDRERIVKWLGPDGQPAYKWSEEAHEILVPIRHLPPRADLAHLLFVHQKKFTPDDYDYSIRRHFAVLHKLYAEGKRTTRRCWYLANYARTLCPERELEFIAAAHDVATSPYDRYTAMVALGTYHGVRGLYWDAVEAFGAAQTLRPDISDAWLIGGEIAISGGDSTRACEWLARGLACEQLPESMTTPRMVSTRYRTLYAIELRKLGRKQIEVGLYQDALASLAGGAMQAQKVVLDEETARGDDLIEARCRHTYADNEYRGHKLAMLMRELFDYLLANDESAKAVELLDAIPWTIEDHPLTIGMQEEARAIRRHMTDAEAYTRFYQQEVTSYRTTSPEQMENPAANPRPHWAITWIKTHKPHARIFEVGPFDGTFAIPILRDCPATTYVGYEMMERAITDFKVHAERYKIDPSRYELRQVAMDTPYPGEQRWTCDGKPHTGQVEAAELPPEEKFDVVLYGEVIEHVQNPVHELTRLRNLLKPDGYLIVTTPWGAFDCGHPPAADDSGAPRGHLGHVRALTPRDLYEMAEAAGLYVADMSDILATADPAADEAVTGHALCAVLRPWISRVPTRYGERRGPAAAFCVPASLWPWNSRTVEAEGMGASEETIVFLARHWADHRELPRKCEVFNMTPRPDTHVAVPYWPRAQLRHLHDRTHLKLIVSRSPAYGQYLDKVIGKVFPKILWLQDAYYDDLNPETASHYERIVVLTEWHKQAMIDQHRVDPDKLTVIPNFLLAEHFTGQRPERKQDHFIYASSPDRGLIKLLKLWPRILDRYPGATLDIFYGWKGCQVLAFSNPDWAVTYKKMRVEYEQLKFQRGITERGMVNHATIAREYQRAGVWAYPTNFHETFCSNAIKARAGGAIPVTTALAALNETASCPEATLVAPDDPNYDEKFLEACFAAVETGDDVRGPMAELAIGEYRIETVVPLWDALMDR